MDMQSESINELAKALAMAQAEMGGVHKDGENPYFKSKYPTLESAVEAVKLALTKNNIAFPQPTTMIGEKLYVVTTFMHSSGQWIKGYFPVLYPKQTMQDVGSATTYARRYALMGLAGIAPEDDDGNSVSQKGNSDASPNPTVAEWKIVQLGNESMDVGGKIGEKYGGQKFKEIVINDPKGAKSLKDWIEEQVNAEKKVHSTLLHFREYYQLFTKENVNAQN